LGGRVAVEQGVDRAFGPGLAQQIGDVARVIESGLPPVFRVRPRICRIVVSRDIQGRILARPGSTSMPY
jgi:hypothetical protein